MSEVFKTVGEYRFNLTDLTIWRGPEYVQVAPKACAILRELIIRPGRVLSHEQLLEAVWPDTFVQPEVLKVHIFELRRALGDDSKHPTYIETVPRRGYRLVAPVRESDLVSPDLPVTKNRLFGQDHTLHQMICGLRRAEQGSRSIFFLTGEPGIGKTAVVKAFCRLAPRLPHTYVAAGECFQLHGRHEPYYPVLQALAGLDMPHFYEAMNRCAPAWLARLTPVPPAERQRLTREANHAAPERMQREICDLLEAITRDCTLLLVLEDIQWADPATIDLLSTLVHRNTPARLMLVCSFRPAELVKARHPLRTALAEWKVKRLCKEIELEPLDETAVRDLLSQELREGVVPDRLVCALMTYAGGNPLYITELTHHLREKRKLWLQNGVWTLDENDGEPSLDFPESIQGLLLSRFEILATETRRVLEYAALVGRLFSIWAVAAISNLPEAELEAECEALSAMRIFLWSAGKEELPGQLESARFEFRPAIFGEAIARQVPPARRIRAQRRLAQKIEDLFGEQRGQRAEDLAWRYEQSRDWEKAIGYLRIAAERALHRWAPREAATCLNRAKILTTRLSQRERRQELQLALVSEMAHVWTRSG